MALSSARLKRYDLSEEELEQRLDNLLSGISETELDTQLTESVRDIRPGTIVIAVVDSVDERSKTVVMDIGGKAEGSVSISEFGETLPEKGQEFEVYYEGDDNHDNTAVLSKRRADRQRAWERVSVKYNEGDEIQGVVQRKIKGGLIVDVEGVSCFLPASQVNLRRTADSVDLIDEGIRARIIKIDTERSNIVISRRKLLEEERQRLKEGLLSEITEEQIRTGVVKNIADFGVFVDLGGIDGLLHITDMSWGRINHPSEMVSLDQEIEVKVLRIDRDRERIALGLKQKTMSPWEGIEERYPVGTKHKANVVNIMSYGAFVKLEEGIEGLVHISEMSWTRRINHPSELVTANQEVEIVVLDISHEKQEISLGMKQAESNPWDLVDEHYPVGTIIEGSVRNLTSYGAFVEIEEGIDGLLHVSDMSWTKKVTHPSEVVKKGDAVRAVVLSVDKEKKRIALGVKQLTPDAWLEEIPNKFHLGDLLSGYVTKTTSFGAFVKMDEDLEGLLHISELADHKIESPEEVLTAGMKVEVRVIRVDVEERKIGLSFVHAEFDENAKFLGEDGKPVVTQTDDDEEGEGGAPSDDSASSEDSPADDASEEDSGAGEESEPAEDAPSDDGPSDDGAESEEEAPAQEEAEAAEEAPAEEEAEASEEAPAEEEAEAAEEAPAEEEAEASEEAPAEEEAEAGEEAPAEEEAEAPEEEAAADEASAEEAPEAAEETSDDGDDSEESDAEDSSGDEDASEEEKTEDAD